MHYYGRGGLMNQEAPQRVGLLTGKRATEMAIEVAAKHEIRVSKAHLECVLKEKNPGGSRKFFPSIKLRDKPQANGRDIYAIADVDFDRWLLRALKIMPPKLFGGLPGVEMERDVAEVQWPTLEEGEE